MITIKADRSKAIERIHYALKNFVIAGVDTTTPFLQFLLSDPDYIKGKVSTRWVEDRIEKFSQDRVIQPALS